MKKPVKKKVAFSRQTWQINPVTRVKNSAKNCSRSHGDDDLHELKSDEQKIKIWSAERQLAGRHHRKDGKGGL
jgi:hypothetical protein